MRRASTTAGPSPRALRRRRKHADERELRRAGEHEHRHHTRLGRAQPGRHRENAEGDAVDADRDPDAGRARSASGSRIDRGHNATIVRTAAFPCFLARHDRFLRHDLPMDAIDRAILRQLQADGRLTNVELAERVRLSPSPCLRRVRALEQAGVIRGYHADIDPAAVGRGFEVTVHVELTLKDRATVEAFEAGIAALDEVVECRRMFGLPDYVVRVAVADQAAYEAFYMNQLAELPGLARVNSQFTMKMVKRGGALPI